MMRQAWIDKRDAVAVMQQCVLAGVSRATVYAQLKLPGDSLPLAVLATRRSGSGPRVRGNVQGCAVGFRSSRSKRPIRNISLQKKNARRNAGTIDLR